MDACKKAPAEKYQFLLVDCFPTTDEDQRLQQSIFPDQKGNVPKANVPYESLYEESLEELVDRSLTYLKLFFTNVFIKKHWRLPTSSPGAIESPAALNQHEKNDVVILDDLRLAEEIPPLFVNVGAGFMAEIKTFQISAVRGRLDPQSIANPNSLA
ncbi:hypothetical protein TNCV_28001 [Trichonephila clavipes]|uniref:Uncharacterized protein n=1 Tax=Trichonephila clavipes TaxID=2585209 RepID=A0A8X6WKV1_TRICX|nr:hypothetical protein TNCV_28001 [Trichonephila clavipes]